MNGSRKKTSDVFGVSNEILPDSYVDRGKLDEELQRLLARPTHVALRGESKCGKSWLRQKVVDDAITIQCRLGKTCVDIYRDALSDLGIRLELERSESGAFSGRAEASTDVGLSLLARLRGGVAVEVEKGHESKSAPIGRDFTDLKFVADLIKTSERRLVVEDFHYLSIEERTKLAFDLKALWDYGVFVVIVGVWSKQNMLLYLNPDLTGRVEEVAIVWSDEDLRQVFTNGGEALGLEFVEELQVRAVDVCFENVGILQKLIFGSLDEMGVTEAQEPLVQLDRLEALDAAAMAYAEQLNPLYQQFAERYPAAFGVEVTPLVSMPMQWL